MDQTTVLMIAPAIAFVTFALAGMILLRIDDRRIDRKHRSGRCAAPKRQLF